MKRNRVPVGVAAIVLRQLADALGAGLSLGDTLAILGKDADLPARHREFIAHLIAQTGRGAPLSAALAAFPKSFPPEAVAAVAAGEKDGSLSRVLDLVASDFELQAAHRMGVRGALAWPVAILGVLVLILAVIMIFVIPSFKDVFSSFGADLPALTLLVMGISDFFVAWWWLAAAVAAGAVALVKAGVIDPRRLGLVDLALMRVPFVRSYVTKVFASRLAQVLSGVVAGAMPAGPAIAYLRGTAGNLELVRLAAVLEAKVGAGADLAEAVRDTPGLPGQLAVSLELGARAGRPEVALRQVLAVTETEAARAMVRLQQAMLVLSYVAAGVIVGGAVIAMYLPIFKLGSAI